MSCLLGLKKVLIMKPQYLLIILLPFLYLSLSCNGKGKAGMEIVDTDSLPDEPDEKTLPIP